MWNSLHVVKIRATGQKCILWSFCCFGLDSSPSACVSESMYWTHKTLWKWPSFVPGGKSTCLLCQTMRSCPWWRDFSAPFVHKMKEQSLFCLWLSRYLQEKNLSFSCRCRLKALSFWPCMWNYCPSEPAAAILVSQQGQVVMMSSN